ncbi:MAG: hypothetical protein U0164_06570 [Gemmatimonadaceae bacterium]
MGPAPQTALSIVVRPVRASLPEVQQVVIEATIAAIADAARARLCFRAPITYAGRTGIADRVSNLRLRDASGDVAVTIENETSDPGGFPYYRHWCATRAVRGDVALHYAMQSYTGRVTPGPQFDFYSHAGGVSFGGMAMFVLPELRDTLRLTIRWDLRDLAPGSIAASTYGEGTIARRGTAESLAQAYYMAGPLGRYAPDEARGSFAGYWLGTPAFSARRELAWTWSMNQYLRHFWADTTSDPYRIFIRALEGTGGGTALQRSFMYGVRPGSGDSTKVAQRNTLAHEMGHMFLGTVDEGGGAGPTWFNEGLNTHLTRALVFSSGNGELADFLDDLNTTARNYYTNAYRLLTADSLARLGFSTGIGAGSAQNVPYTRGSLWWATMDERIRRSSHGGRSLDDVVLALVRRWRGGAPRTVQSIVDALVVEIGDEARREYERVIVRGETVEPSSEAFGSCFERYETTISQGSVVARGYQWRRVPGLTDEDCRKW